MQAVKVEVTCDSCRGLFQEVRQQFYCDHCHKFYSICPRCKEKKPQCSYCGIPLKKRLNPKRHR